MARFVVSANMAAVEAVVSKILASQNPAADSKLPCLLATGDAFSQQRNVTLERNDGGCHVTVAFAPSKALLALAEECQAHAA